MSRPGNTEPRPSPQPQDAPGWALCCGAPEVSPQTMCPRSWPGMGRSSNSRLQPLNLGQWAGEHQGTSSPWGLRDNFLCLSEGQQAGGPQGASPPRSQSHSPLLPRRSTPSCPSCSPWWSSLPEHRHANKLTVMVRQAAEPGQVCTARDQHRPSACPSSPAGSRPQPRRPGLTYVFPASGSGKSWHTNVREYV